MDSASTNQPAKVEPLQFPCSQCGASLEFSPDAGALQCARCGAIHQAEHHSGEIVEHDYFESLVRKADAQTRDVGQVATCNLCGARFELDQNLHADDCPYCASPLVLDPADHRSIPVHAVVPFRVNAKDAKEAFKRWLSGLWFAPARLAKFARQERDLAGAYLPHWTFDSFTRSRYVAERGDRYVVPVREMVKRNGRWIQRTRMETRIRWTPASGQVDQEFDDVLVLATDSVPTQLVEAVAPWRLSELVSYAPRYLSGFTSSLYTIELDEGFARARAIMRDAIRDSVRQDIGGDVQRIHELDTHHSQVRFKHVLLPLWLAAFHFRGKTYRFVVNGSTGEVQGERPYSAWKIAAAVIIATVVLGGLTYWVNGGAL